MIYDEMEDRPNPADERAEAWEFWHERANQLEAENARLRDGAAAQLWPKTVIPVIIDAIAPAVENLACHQEQCDMDGVMVKVSRQALNQVVEAINQIAIALAPARPMPSPMQTK